MFSEIYIYTMILGILFLAIHYIAIDHMVSQNLVNVGSSNGLLPDGTKPLPEPVLSYNLVALSYCGICLREISQ